MSKTAPIAMKATGSNSLRKIAWADPDFKDMTPELEEDGGIGTHSNQKVSADMAANLWVYKWAS